MIQGGCRSPKTSRNKSSCDLKFIRLVLCHPLKKTKIQKSQDPLKFASRRFGGAILGIIFHGARFMVVYRYALCTDRFCVSRYQLRPALARIAATPSLTSHNDAPIFFRQVLLSRSMALDITNFRKYRSEKIQNSKHEFLIFSLRLSTR